MVSSFLWIEHKDFKSLINIESFLMSSCEWGVALTKDKKIVAVFGQDSDFFHKENLLGKDFLSFVHEADKRYIHEIIYILFSSAKNKISNKQYSTMFISLDMGLNKPISMCMNGYCDQNKDGNYYIYLSFFQTPPFLSTSFQESSLRKGFLSRANFIHVARQYLEKTLNGESHYHMTCFHTKNFVKLRKCISPENFEALRLKLSGVLRAYAVGGGTVGLLSTGKYGLIHHSDVLGIDIIERLKLVFSEFEKLETKLDNEVSISYESIDFSIPTLARIDALRCIEYLILKFSDQKDDQPFVFDINQNMESFVNETLSRVSHLRETISDQRFDIVYQPIIDLSDQTVHHYEALTRITGASSPLRFIALAEETGMIQEFDLAVFQKILETLKECHEKHPKKKICIAVNISAQSLESQLFFDELDLLIKPFDHLRSNILFEITETSQMENFERANAVIQKLRKKGHLICLDDVGSGTTSFLSLNHLRVDYVKIDGDYIQFLNADQRQKSILRSIVNTCKELDIPMIAEKIENHEQLQKVKELGIEFGQGFLFGKPSSKFSIS